MDSIAETLTGNSSTGLEYWMARVAQECDRALRDFAPEPVHDLRVALRRCRSIASVFMSFDPHPDWRQAKNEAKGLFEQLGALRDTQVMLEWIQRLAPPGDETSAVLNNYLLIREVQFKGTASKALRDFDQRKWDEWTKHLPRRMRRIPPEGTAFQQLALERWTDAHELHHRAIRNRSHIAYHQLRIGLKKFRYVVENFLPSRHELWGGDLRALQDLLGDTHDLHILWQTALAVKAFRSERERIQWRQRTSEEIDRRLKRYRQIMLGEESLWRVWRAGLPGAGQLSIAALSRLRAWASFRDPDFAHSEHVVKLTLQIYDGLDSLELLQDIRLPGARFLLEAAALVHDVGLNKTQKKHQIVSYRMVRKFSPSPGLSEGDLRAIALIARFHQGALPCLDQKAFSYLAQEERKTILLLSGILRLADAFGRVLRQSAHRLLLKRTAETLYIEASGYSESDGSAETLAAARHLLETALHMPVLLRRP